MQKVLDALNSKLSIPFHVGDITTHLPIPANTYDVVYCISVIEHLPPEKRVYAVIELWRLIKPGGHLLLTLDVSLTNQNEDGIPLSQVELFVNEIGNLQDFPSISLFPLPHDLLTPQKPSYGLAPVRLGKKVIRTGIESALLRLKKVSLPGFPSMCCLMIKFQKTANHVPR
jgi:SAM-dependent methyltransferase